MRRTLLAYVATRYEQAQATSDELQRRALELIVAACVTEWRHSPDEVMSPSSEALPEPSLEWSEDDVPKVDYDVLAPELDQSRQDVDAPLAPPDEPDRATERIDERAWWTSPSEPDPTPPPAEPTRGAWEPPRRP